MSHSLLRELRIAHLRGETRRRTRRRKYRSSCLLIEHMESLRGSVGPPGALSHVGIGRGDNSLRCTSSDTTPSRALGHGSDRQTCKTPPHDTVTKVHEGHSRWLQAPEDIATALRSSASLLIVADLHGRTVCLSSGKKAPVTVQCPSRTSSDGATLVATSGPISRGRPRARRE